MTAVMIALLAVAIALFVVFMGLKAQQRGDGKRRDGGDGGGSSASDTDSRRVDESDHGGDSGGDAGGGDGGSGGGD